MVKVGDKKEMSVVVKGDKPFKILDVKGATALVEAVADSGRGQAGPRRPDRVPAERRR